MRRAFTYVAFTYVELVIVMAIIMLLSVAAFGASSTVIRNLRFSNSFNKIVLLVQQARSEAIISKGTASKYGIRIRNNGLLLERYADGFIQETASLEATTGLKFFAQKQVAAQAETCGVSASIEYARGGAEATLQCDDNLVPLMRFGIEETKDGNVVKSKNFLIHTAAGIAQVR